jgi:alpha-L-fucosidase
VGPTDEGNIPAGSSAILKRIGKWKKAADESFRQVQTDSELVNIPGVLVTKRDKTLYIHMNKLLVGNGLKLKPINILPAKATLLNNGEAIDCAVNLCPSDHATQQPYLRLRDLPVNDMGNTVLIAKLEFDRPLEQIVVTKNPETNIELTK